MAHLLLFFLGMNVWKFLVYAIGFMFFFTPPVMAEVDGTCLQQGRYRGVKDPDTGNVGFYVHRIGDMYLLHRCVDEVSGVCEIFQRATFDQLCEIEKVNRRYQKFILGIFQSAFFGSGLLSTAASAAAQQATMESKCPGAHLLKSLTDRNYTSDQALIDFTNQSRPRSMRVAGIGFIDVNDPTINKPKIISKAMSYSSDYVKRIFEHNSGIWRRNIHPVFNREGQLIDNAPVGDYCQGMFDPTAFLNR